MIMFCNLGTALRSSCILGRRIQQNSILKYVWHIWLGTSEGKHPICWTIVFVIFMINFVINFDVFFLALKCLQKFVNFGYWLFISENRDDILVISISMDSYYNKSWLHLNRGCSLNSVYISIQYSFWVHIKEQNTLILHHLAVIANHTKIPNFG